MKYFSNLIFGGLLAFATLLPEFTPIGNIALAASPITSEDFQAGFSPDGSAETLVLETIRAAHKSIRVAAYSFTSSTVTRALIDARKRGIEVVVLVDYKNNLQEDRSGKARAAIQALLTSGIQVRSISKYAMQHSKYMVIDDDCIQTGSFNYSSAAATRNSENVIVIHNRGTLAQRYIANWQMLYGESAPIASNF